MLDAEACWRAMRSRDLRFEGRFVTGVLTTRIYCRPGCPARLPHRENVEFFASAAAAELSGLRPCLRCRPDKSLPPQGTPATVRRALRLMSEGHTDDMDALAERLGIGARHLRRLFLSHLGAPPVAVLRTQRLHFARKLLEETALPVTDVAHASGFGSLRRFNDAFRASFHATPTEHRKKARRGEGSATEIRLVLPYRAPLAWADLLAFLGARAIPGVERVDGDAYLRTVEVSGMRGVIDVRPAKGTNALELRVALPAVGPLQTVAQRVRTLFDLDVDPRSVARVLGRDSLLAASVEKYPGLRVPGAWDGFELALRAILGQQISVAAARTLAGRLVAVLGEPLATGVPGLTHTFPSARAVARAKLEGLGLTRARGATLSALAKAVDRGDLRLDAAGGEAAMAALLAIDGIGPWTAGYVGMRALGLPDEFPADDLVLRRAIDGADLAARAETWRPFRAYAAMHLWRGAGERKEPCKEE